MLRRRGEEADVTTVLAPASLEEAADLLRGAAEDGTPVALRGSGSQDMPAAPIVLSTGVLAGVVEYKPDDLTLVVRAGTTLEEIDHVLAVRHLSAVLPEDAPSRTIGGVMATGASPYRRLRYGPTRERVIEVRMSTGYGEVIRGGGRLVKNVTGYDIPRLMTGSHGVLGLIGEVCLKLWPRPPAGATIAVEDPEEAFQQMYQPLAVLETESGSLAFVEGVHEAVDAACAAFGDAVSNALEWPSPISNEHHVSVRVRPSALGDALSAVRESVPERFIAQHGVGRIDVGYDEFDADRLAALREAVRDVGVVVVERTTLDLDRWGIVPDTIAVQRDLKQLFDPSGILNPGHLPGLA